MKKKIYILISIISIIIITITFIIYFWFKNSEKAQTIPALSKQNTIDDIFFKFDINDANIDSFLIYGTHLNISGNTPLLDTSKEISSVNISLMNTNFDEKIYNTDYQIDSNILSFNTSCYINSGIYLEDISAGEYVILLKINYTDNTYNYYTFLNSPNFEELEYFTISKNNKTNFLKFKYIDSYILLDVTNIDMPAKIYDICLDAGHGGNDPGAVYKNFEESKINLDFVKSLKDNLEKQGLKVALTRSDDTRVKNYGTSGRATLPYELHTKYMFSIHLNSSYYENTNSGIEIYCPNKCDLSFAKALSENIVNIANTTYSKNNICKVDDGVYVRTFTGEEIEDFRKEAISNGYTLYESLTTATPYLFIIRETGGKSTGAYFDGRNTIYEPNYHYNSNIGCESYLLELGYINNKTDIENITKNKQLYIDAITKSILSKINNNLNM